MSGSELLLKQASLQMDDATSTLVLSLLVEPKIGLYYINEHVINLDAQVLQS